MMNRIIDDLIEIPESSEQASWLTLEIVTFAENVLSLVPDGFAAYARVFHPVRIFDPDTSHGVATWADAAQYTGRTAHRGMQWPSLIGTNQGTAWLGSVSIDSPSRGSIPDEVARVLVDVLRAETTTPGRCWFGIWEGWGGLGAVIAAAPRFALPNRRYHLLGGPIEVASELAAAGPTWDPPSLWWPSDHAWCVATEIDFNTTYVGGSRSSIDKLLASDVEVYAVEPTDGIDYASDNLNPQPPDV